MMRGYTTHEPGADVRFGLAYERLAAEDAAAKAWLDRHCRTPDPDEVKFGPVPRDWPGFKPNVRAGWCLAFGCCRKARAKGMCDRHYRIARREGLTEAAAREARKARRAA